MELVTLLEMNCIMVILMLCFDTQVMNYARCKKSKQVTFVFFCGWFILEIRRILLQKNKHFGVRIVSKECVYERQIAEDCS